MCCLDTVTMLEKFGFDVLNLSDSLAETPASELVRRP